MKVKLTQEEIDTMSYDDVAFLILKAYSKKMKTPDLFKKVIKAMNLPEEEFSRGIGDFLELLITDKRFTMLENGFWDLKTNQSQKIIFEDDEDEDDEIEFIDDEDEIIDEDPSNDFDEEDLDDEDEEDDLNNLVIIDSTEEREEDDII
ncbi:MAG: DNA-directed RNA polymerase subunit delta [Bacilli bacterium]|nr:DNA-directed RNA polymerase subunit delta [Bacilli bacterium]